MSLPATFWRPDLADIYDEPGTTYDQQDKIYDGLDPVAYNTTAMWYEEIEDVPA